ncbi:MAG: class I SAM-dependent methyltransferase [Methanoculleus sp.]|uniref:class I SAM-dependent methyltransferase n=2 Tax=Methanoculleus TaxID=45989 RepID=UPI0025D9AFD1|nr:MULTISPECIES: class I SAM-dependent methyltransferase [unclassified Methanoculleus]MCK9299112.1 class I SAM-dependent methyltransferase [Methanoculleus sp.]MDD2255339.1 class I SAM-dependent methyltransferase [Methanoculleus sp.]MDD3215560.1 class I SAM-dependent methyltransferase [Methanoculleus sp.]MDD4472141.1 class I SAM-dependent methyltransferase [Methanoculleus sp.]HOI57297.1 class I SAM-dependent methyltransferase [Methanoculleus sp.]
MVVAAAEDKIDDYEVDSVTKLIKYYQWLLGTVLSRSFGLWERLGIHIVPNHFYQPIPDVRHLDDRLWERSSSLVGIDMDEQSQTALLSRFHENYKPEYDRFPTRKTGRPFDYFVNNGGFESVDGEILYCTIRHFKPERIIEIGSGNSTYLAASAIRKNKEEDPEYACELIAIEPYPNRVLQDGFPNLSRLIEEPVQNVPFSVFERLGENDILFIDSSHVLKVGSDVQYEYNEILPRLNKGVLIHVHDIFLPFEYPKEWICWHHLFWTEQYLLQAFLTYNPAFKVVWGGYYMHRSHPELLEEAFSTYNREKIQPGSFWMRKIQ